LLLFWIRLKKGLIIGNPKVDCVSQEESYAGVFHPVPGRWDHGTLFRCFIESAIYMVARFIHWPHVDRPVFFRLTCCHELG
jgi:hypothetical protein